MCVCVCIHYLDVNSYTKQVHCRTFQSIRNRKEHSGSGGMWWICFLLGGIEVNVFTCFTRFHMVLHVFTCVDMFLHVFTQVIIDRIG